MSPQTGRHMWGIVCAGIVLVVASSRAEECMVGVDSFSTLQAKNLLQSKPSAVSLMKQRASRTTHTCYDFGGWTDSDNDGCKEYEENQWCMRDGRWGHGWAESWGGFADFARDGDSALEACCCCGGGSHVQPMEAPECTDAHLGWEDSDGWTCKHYKDQKWCGGDGSLGSGWNRAWRDFEVYANHGMTAAQACCACGGGVPSTPAPTPAPAPTPTCGSKAHYCHRTCMALGNSQPSCRRFCEDQFDDMSAIINEYCQQGVCDPNTPKEGCTMRASYCTKICKAFTQFEGQPIGFCKLQCNLNFCEIKKYWGQFCAAGLCH